jgi:hypothetical protein
MKHPVYTLQGKAMGGGKEISLGEGNRAQEIGGGYRKRTGVMWKNEEKRKRKGHSRSADGYL